MFIKPELALSISFKIIEAPLETQFCTFSGSGIINCPDASRDNDEYSLYLIRSLSNIIKKLWLFQLLLIDKTSFKISKLIILDVF